jgi:2'-5' RNA ligase
MKSNLFVWFELPAGVKAHLKQHAAKGLDNPDGDLHVTAFYEKDVDAAHIKQIMAELRRLVQGWEPVRASTTGAGIFDGGSDQGRFPLIYLINAPGIERWRVAIMEVYERACGRPCSTRFGYIPHLTLAYVEEGQELIPGWELDMVQQAPPAWSMEKIGVKWGDKAFMMQVGTAGWQPLRSGSM